MSENQQKLNTVIVVVLMLIFAIFGAIYVFLYAIIPEKDDNVLLVYESEDEKIFAEHDKRVNINTATVKELMGLDNIGEVTANAIVSFREQNGDFMSIEEIMNVKGIGEKTFEGIKYDIVV